MEFLSELGYIGMFVSAFLAATILPVSSEIVLAALLTQEFSPSILVLVATTGNVLGAVVNYGLGLWASLHVLRRLLGMSEQAYEKAEQRFRKYGMASLLLAWMPVIGDPLTVLAGALRVNFLWFLLLVTIGKGLRYIVLAQITLGLV